MIASPQVNDHLSKSYQPVSDSIGNIDFAHIISFDQSSTSLK